MPRTCQYTSRTVKAREALLCLAAVALLALSGCASTSTFTGYPYKINPLIQNLQTRQPIDFGQCFLTECQSADAVLYDMERGRLAQIQGNFDISRQDFAAAIARIKENDEKAQVSLSEMGANLAAVATNDNALPYVGAGYERVMLHHYQALNYLNNNDLEDAGVEVRLANAEQEEALRRHEAELEKAQTEAQQKRVHDTAQDSTISSAYAPMDEMAGKVKNSFQNAYTFYLSGFIYEALQQPGDAYIDYKKALEIYPENSFLQKDVLRLAKELNMTEELEQIGSRFAVDPAELPPGGGDLLVLFEEGFVPQKEEVKIPLPVPHIGFLPVAFPVYRERWSDSRSLAVEQSGEFLGMTEPICDFRALSVKALKEQVPVIAARQLLRLVAKGATAHVAQKKFGPLGGLGMTVWNFLSENADLRSWNSLPADAQVLRVALAAGTHRLTLRQEGVPAAARVTVNVTGGGRYLLHVVRAGREFYTSVVALDAAKTVQAGEVSAK